MVLQGCTEREGALAFILLLLMQFCTGPALEENTSPGVAIFSVGSTDFTAVDGNALCQTNNARINLSAQAATTGIITKVVLGVDAANTTNGTFTVRFMSLENTSGTNFQMNDHVDVSTDWDACAPSCTITLPTALTMQAGEYLACATNQTLSLTLDNEAGFSERLQTGTTDFPNGSDGISIDLFNSLGSNLRLHLAGTN